jgi:UDP-glucose 4-epimerase
VDPRIKLYEIDLVDAKKVEEIFKQEHIDYVYHFAAYAAEGLSPFIRNFNYTNNVLCSINIMNNCINYDVKKLVFTSSMAVYGEGKPPFTEDQQQSPIDPYGIAKYTVEQDIKLANDQF